MPAPNRTRVVISLACTVAAGSLLAGCRTDQASGGSGNSGGSGESASRDACGVVTKEHVQAALSRHVTRSSASGGGSDSTCTYAAGATRVEITLDRNAKRAGFEHDRKKAKTEHGHLDFKMPYGRKFSYSENGDRSAAVEILHDHTTLSVSVSGTAHAKEAAQRLVDAGSDRL